MCAYESACACAVSMRARARARVRVRVHTHQKQRRVRCDTPPSPSHTSRPAAPAVSDTRCGYFRPLAAAAMPAPGRQPLLAFGQAVAAAVVAAGVRDSRFRLPPHSSSNRQLVTRRYWTNILSEPWGASEARALRLCPRPRPPASCRAREAGCHPLARLHDAGRAGGPTAQAGGLQEAVGLPSRHLAHLHDAGRAVE